jgi:hypothetical protein
VAGKNAYSIPFTTWVVKATGVPFTVIPPRGPTAEAVGSIARRLLAPAPTVIVKLSWFPLQLVAPNDEPLRPSSQVSICLAETTGT